MRNVDIIPEAEVVNALRAARGRADPAAQAQRRLSAVLAHEREERAARATEQRRGKDCGWL